MVINRLYQSPTINTSDSYYKDVAVQFTVLSQDEVASADLGDAAFDALFPEGANPPIRFVDGKEITRLPGMSHGPTADPTGPTGGDLVWRTAFDYTFLVSRG
jgi:hypothetical protein